MEMQSPNLKRELVKPIPNNSFPLFTYETPVQQKCAHTPERKKRESGGWVQNRKYVSCTREKLNQAKLLGVYVKPREAKVFSPGVNTRMQQKNKVFQI